MISKTTLLILLLLHATVDAHVFYKNPKTLRSCYFPQALCVSLRECSDLRSKMTSLGGGLKALQVITDNICSLTKTRVNVCCRINRRSALGGTTVPKSDFRQMVHDLYTKKKFIVNRWDCGRIVDNAVFRGDKEVAAHFKDFPWMAILMFQHGPVELKSMCGGTLISKQYVLTAAHCADQKNNKLLQVRFGFQKEKCRSCMDYSIRNIILHEDYDPATLQNDVALLYLAEPIKEIGTIVPICLPIPELMENEGKFTKNNIFTAVRYGYKSSDNSTVAMKTHVVLENDAYCSSITYAMPDGQKCVKSRGICQGDSGSALVYPTRATGSRSQLKIFQMGIISSGYSDCAPDTPIRMISVNYYLVWILEHITK